jgi:hypothetical protein
VPVAAKTFGEDTTVDILTGAGEGSEPTVADYPGTAITAGNFTPALLLKANSGAAGGAFVG